MLHLQKLQPLLRVEDRSDGDALDLGSSLADEPSEIAAELDEPSANDVIWHERCRAEWSGTPDIEDFEEMVRCQKGRYEFETDGLEQLQRIIEGAPLARRSRLSTWLSRLEGPQTIGRGAGFWMLFALVVLAACVCCLYVREKQGKPMFTNLETTNIAPSQTEMKAGTPAV